jgi:AraC-like DNA-binding protein
MTVKLTPPDFRLLRFSTAKIEADKRLAAWSDVMARALLRMQVERLGGKPFQAHVMLRALGAVRIATGRIGPSISRRNAGIVAADNDDMCVLAATDGRVVAAHGRHHLTLHAGEAVMFSCAEEMSLTAQAPVRVLFLRIPFSTLARYGAPQELVPWRAIPRQTSALKLLIQYGTALFEDDDIAMTPGAGRVVVDHMIDLVALAIGVPRETATRTASRGAGRADSRRGQDAKLHIIKADIMRNLTWRDLSVSWFAARHGLSTRQLYRLFEQDGMPFAQFVLEHRLIAAQGMMLNPRFADHNISAIALQCGFGDISYFNRCFRLRYGATPSKVRGG